MPDARPYNPFTGAGGGGAGLTAQQQMDLARAFVGGSISGMGASRMLRLVRSSGANPLDLPIPEGDADGVFVPAANVVYADADHIAIAPPGVIPADLMDGDVFRLFAERDNTGPVVLQLGSLQERPVVMEDGTALTAGALQAGRLISITWDETNTRWILRLVGDEQRFVESGNYNASTQMLTLTLNAGDTIQIDLSALVTSAELAAAVTAGNPTAMSIAALLNGAALLEESSLSLALQNLIRGGLVNQHIEESGIGFTGNSGNVYVLRNGDSNDFSVGTTDWHALLVNVDVTERVDDFERRLSLRRHSTLYILPGQIVGANAEYVDTNDVLQTVEGEFRYDNANDRLRVSVSSGSNVDSAHRPEVVVNTIHGLTLRAGASPHLDLLLSNLPQESSVDTTNDRLIIYNDSGPGGARVPFSSVPITLGQLPAGVMLDSEFTAQAVRTLLSIPAGLNFNDVVVNATVVGTGATRALSLVQADGTTLQIVIGDAMPDVSGLLSDPQLSGTTLSFAVEGQSTRVSINLASLVGGGGEDDGAVFVPPASVFQTPNINEITMEVLGIPSTTPLSEGSTFRFFLEQTPTGTVTLALNLFGLQPLVRADGSAVEVGDLAAGRLMTVTWDATNTRWVSNIAPPGTGGAAAPNASTTVRGLVEIATSTESLEGTDTERAITPALLSGKISETEPCVLPYFILSANTPATPDELTRSTESFPATYSGYATDATTLTGSQQLWCSLAVRYRYRTVAGSGVNAQWRITFCAPFRIARHDATAANVGLTSVVTQIYYSRIADGTDATSGLPATRTVGTGSGQIPAGDVTGTPQTFSAANITIGGNTWYRARSGATGDNPLFAMHVNTLDFEGSEATRIEFGLPAGYADPDATGQDGNDGDDGADGEDGVGYEYFYTATADETEPQRPIASTNYGLATVSSLGGVVWTRIPPSLSADAPILWRIQRAVSGTPGANTDIGTVEFSAASIFGRYGADGEDGAGGGGTPDDNSIGFAQLEHPLIRSFPPTPAVIADDTTANATPVALDVHSRTRAVSPRTDGTGYRLVPIADGGPKYLGRHEADVAVALDFIDTGFTGWAEAQEIEFRVGSTTGSGRTHYRLSVTDLLARTASAAGSTASDANSVVVEGVFPNAEHDIRFGRTSGNSLLVTTSHTDADLQPLEVWAIDEGDPEEGFVRADLAQDFTAAQRDIAQSNIGGPFASAIGGARAGWESEIIADAIELPIGAAPAVEFVFRLDPLDYDFIQIYLRPIASEADPSAVPPTERVYGSTTVSTPLRREDLVALAETDVAAGADVRTGNAGLGYVYGRTETIGSLGGVLHRGPGVLTWRIGTIGSDTNRGRYQIQHIRGFRRIAGPLSARIFDAGNYDVATANVFVSASSGSEVDLTPMDGVWGVQYEFEGPVNLVDLTLLKAKPAAVAGGAVTAANSISFPVAFESNGSVISRTISLGHTADNELLVSSNSTVGDPAPLRFLRVSGDVTAAVRYDGPQELTEGEQDQAQDNIGGPFVTQSPSGSNTQDGGGTPEAPMARWAGEEALFFVTSTLYSDGIRNDMRGAGAEVLLNSNGTTPYALPFPDTANGLAFGAGRSMALQLPDLADLPDRLGLAMRLRVAALGVEQILLHGFIELRITSLGSVWLRYTESTGTDRQHMIGVVSAGDTTVFLIELARHASGGRTVRAMRSGDSTFTVTPSRHYAQQTRLAFGARLNAPLEDNESHFLGNIADIVLWQPAGNITDGAGQEAVNDTSRELLYRRFSRRAVDFGDTGAQHGSAYFSEARSINVAGGSTYPAEFRVPIRNLAGHPADRHEVVISGLTPDTHGFENVAVNYLVGSEEYLAGTLPADGGPLTIRGAQADGENLRLRIRNAGSTALTGFGLNVLGFDRVSPFEFEVYEAITNIITLTTGTVVVFDRAIPVDDIVSVVIAGVAGHAQPVTTLIVPSRNFVVQALGNRTKAVGDVVIAGWTINDSACEVMHYTNYSEPDVPFSTFQFIRTGATPAGLVDGIECKRQSETNRAIGGLQFLLRA